jgi:hypothetical protein
MEKSLRGIIGSNSRRKEYFNIKTSTKGWSTDWDHKKIQNFRRRTFKSSNKLEAKNPHGKEGDWNGSG